MTVQSFRAEPRLRKVVRIKRIYGFFCKHKYGAMLIRNNQPDLSVIHDEHYDWEESFCRKVEEVLPDDAPEPLGKNVFSIIYHYDNLLHIVITRRSVARVLHFVGKTLVEWYSKK